ncbi:type II toxin-antitoxin system HicB family antitoxin [Ruminococcus flavefaciens]|uniref:type II toxin-antitoxin system HicB family antitoxin n=1 Tax=Ruminococcus flavefaciens TaxID=1265 RepID=UPI0026EDE927|nr:type II toxin-antitoxin system HicB family antitoxin [Ruminococcus flavefaciens]
MTGSNVLEYKGYIGTVEFSAADNILFGKVIGINGLVSYEGNSISTLRKDFEAAVDNYLEMCEEKGIEPQKCYKGSFNIRISPELHRTIAIIAASHNKTLNATVEEALQDYAANH